MAFIKNEQHISLSRWVPRSCFAAVDVPVRCAALDISATLMAIRSDIPGVSLEEDLDGNRSEEMHARHSQGYTVRASSLVRQHS